jgi:hypothetical protein
LIVCGVAHSDTICPKLRRRCAQKSIPYLPGRVLRGEFVLTLVGRNIEGLTEALDAETMRGGLDELRILCRTGTHVMVQMSHAELEGERLAEVPQSMQEDHRIWATGNRDQKCMAASNHLIVLDSLLHLLQEGIHRCSIQADRLN